MTGKKDGADKEASHNANSSASSRVSAKANEKLNTSGELVEGSATGKPPHRRPGSSASSRSDYVAPPSTSSGPGLSPTSSVASLASEKSSLNPYAKVLVHSRLTQPHLHSRYTRSDMYVLRFS